VQQIVTADVSAIEASAPPSTSADAHDGIGTGPASKYRLEYVAPDAVHVCVVEEPRTVPVQLVFKNAVMEPEHAAFAFASVHEGQAGQVTVANAPALVCSGKALGHVEPCGPSTQSEKPAARRPQ
jgi:hypothetical protein